MWDARRGPYSVSDAVRDYLEEITAEKPARPVRDARYAFENSVLPELGHLLIENLTTDRLVRWRNALAARPLGVRKKRTASIRASRAVADTDEARRKRKATANRSLTMLKAALNRAFHGGRVASDMVWRKVKPFARVEKPVIRYLSADEARRLVNACPPDFRRLVQAALLTGCRYSELTNLSCVDFNTDSDTLTIRQAKAGKPRHVVLTSEGRTLFIAWTAGRSANTHIFVRDDGHPWGKSHQQRPLIEASEIAKISPPVNFHVLRHTHASHLAMKGVGLGVVAAQLGHADTRMTEKHYAHLAPSYVADTIRAHFPTLGIGGERDGRATARPKNKKPCCYRESVRAVWSRALTPSLQCRSSYAAFNGCWSPWWPMPKRGARNRPAADGLAGVDADPAVSEISL